MFYDLIVKNDTKEFIFGITNDDSSMQFDVSIWDHFNGSFGYTIMIPNSELYTDSNTGFNKRTKGIEIVYEGRKCRTNLQKEKNMYIFTVDIA